MQAPYAPVFTTPAAPGQLSNKRGSNTGADALGLTALFSTPSGTDRLGNIRVVATRTKLAGGGQTSQVAQDTGWVAGLLGVASLPSGISVLDKMACVVYGGRVYIYGVDGDPTTKSSNSTPNGAPFMSASLKGASVGQWRLEQPAVDPTTGNLIYANDMIVLNGRLYITGTTTKGGVVRDLVWYAPINPDGTVSAWKQAEFDLPAVANTGFAINGDTDGSTYAWIHVFANSAGTPAASYAPISLTDGSITAAWTATTACPQLRLGPALYKGQHNDAQWTNALFVLGGSLRTDIIGATVTAATGVIGGWTTQTNTVPAALQWYGYFYNPKDARYYLFGGSSANDTLVAHETTNVWKIAPSAFQTATAWTAATALPQARAAVFAWPFPVTEKQTVTGAVTGGHAIGYAGGATAGAAVADTYTSFDTAATWYGTSNAGSGSTGQVATADLGTGGSVTTNADGSRTVVFNYGAFGVAALISGFNDGDEVQFSVEVMGGDGFQFASSPGLTTVRIGQAPTLTGATPANASTPNNGKPTLSAQYNAGAGGGPIKSYRIQLAGAGVAYDSGVLYDGKLSVSPNFAPLLPNGVVVTMTITATSTDDPMSGATASVTSTTTFTPTYTAPAVPTSVTATTDDANGKITVGWTNPGGSAAATNRVYFRKTGTSAWTLLRDGVTAVIGSAQSVDLMDQLNLLTSWDFAVAAVSAAPGESALSSVAAATINGILPSFDQGYTVMLHVAGNGPAQHIGLRLAEKTMDVTRVRDVVESLPFNATAPTVTYGTANYRRIHFRHLMRDDPSAAEAILNAAAAGSTLCFRNRMGDLIYCGLPASFGRTEEKMGSHVYLTDDLVLVETAFTYAP